VLDDHAAVGEVDVAGDLAGEAHFVRHDGRVLILCNKFKNEPCESRLF
jgi:hypothetical protein